MLQEKEYYLCKREAREEMDLREIAGKIQDVIHSVKPDAVVRVEKDHYCVALSRGEAIKVGKAMSKAFPISAHEITRRLFKGKSVKN